jgi:hypothetical protein
VGYGLASNTLDIFVGDGDFNTLNKCMDAIIRNEHVPAYQNPKRLKDI